MNLKKNLELDNPSPEQLGEIFKYLIISYTDEDRKENLAVLLNHAIIPNINQLFQSAIDGCEDRLISQLNDMSLLLRHEKNPLDPNIFLQHVLSRSTISEEEGEKNKI